MATSLTKKGLLAAADKVIVAARPALEIVSQFTTDFSDEFVKPGTGIAVDVMAAAAQTFTKGTYDYGTATGGTIKPIIVATDIRKISNFSLDDLDALEDETAHLWDKFAPVAGRAVAVELVKSVTAKLAYSAATAQVTLGGSTLADFFALRGYVEGTAKIDPSTCVLLLAPTTYSTLCSVLNSGIVGDGSVVRGANIGQALGFKAVYSAPTAPVQSGTSEGTAVNKGVGFIVPENAVAVVNRVVKPIKGNVGGLIEFGTHTDEVSGVTLSHRVVYNAATGECFWTAEGLFGSKLTKLDASGNATGAPGFYQIVVS